MGHSPFDVFKGRIVTSIEDTAENYKVFYFSDGSHVELETEVVFPGVATIRCIFHPSQTPIEYESNPYSLDDQGNTILDSEMDPLYADSWADQEEELDDEFHFDFHSFYPPESEKD